jgi:preprotein translocase subunit SecF
MEFFKIHKDIPFMRYSRLFNIISLITFLIAVGSLATKGLNFGVDFTGGTVMEIAYKQAPDLDRVRATLA